MANYSLTYSHIPTKEYHALLEILRVALFYLILFLVLNFASGGSVVGAYDKSFDRALNRKN